MINRLANKTEGLSRTFAVGNGNLDGEHEAEVRTLLELLSRTGGLEVLSLAVKGIKPNVNSDLAAGISRRQYDARISELTKSGLIKRANDTYIQTRFGKMLWRKYIPQLEDAFFSGRRSSKLSGAKENRRVTCKYSPLNHRGACG